MTGASGRAPGGTERLALALGVLLAAGLMWPLRHGLTDTAFVWLRYAEHLARGDGLVFNAGERVYAALNPLWIALLADAMALHLDGLLVARLVGGLAALLSVGLFVQLVRRTVRTPIVRAVATVGWASQAWMARDALGGVETTLAVTLVLAGFVALTEGAEWGDRPVRTGALWALAALTRPGAVLVLVLYLTALLVDAKSRPGLRRLVFGACPAVAIYGAWLLFAWTYFGTAWPQPLALAASSPTLAEWWGRTGAHLSTLAGTDGALALAGAVAFVLARREPHPPHPAPALRLLPLAWIVSLPALLAARGAPVSPRNLLLVSPVIHWLAWRALDRWWTSATPSMGARARGVVASLVLGALVVGLNVHVYASRVVPEVRADTAALEGSLVRWGRWLATHAAPGSTVASEAPGALAYYSDLRVLDLSGLRSPRVLEVARAFPDRELVARLAFAPAGRADYVVDHGPARARLARAPYRDAFELLDERDGYDLYRIHWDRWMRSDSVGAASR